MAENSTSISPGGDASTADDGVLEWELGLPSAEDLTPLSQTLIPPELASAFSISPEPFHSLLDVHRASHNTVSTLRRLNSYPPAASDRAIPIEDRLSDESDSSTVRSDDLVDGPSDRASKRPRLVWNPHLHKRFIDVVSHLGIKNAVPKKIMELMNVEGLTRENVASHLQKYRLHLKRISNEGPSSSNPPFEPAPAPSTLGEQPILVSSYAVPPPRIPMPMLGMANREGSWSYHGNEFHQPYGGGFGSIPMFPSFLPNGN